MQAAALQTFRCCCRCWGDLGQPGVGEGRLKYEISHQGSSQNHCSFHHFMENIFCGHHQRAGSGAAHLLTETPVKGKVPLGGPCPQSGFRVHVPLGTAGFLRGAGGVKGGNATPPRAGGLPGGPDVTSICCHPTADAALALRLLSPLGRAARKQELFF